MHKSRSILIGTLGAIEGLLLARLVLTLLAARPSNPSFAALFMVTAPLRAPFAAFDVAQPRFGAVLELSTLAACMLVGAAFLCLIALERRPAQPGRG